MKIGLIGLGLIGASLGLNFVGTLPEARVYGYDIDPQTLRQALDIECVHETGSIEAVVRDADYIFICTPVSLIREMVAAIRPFVKPGAVVTDVGSTKQDAVKALALLPNGVTGIGGHPMAGSERQGITGADRYLFENAVYVLTPDIACPASALDGLRRLVLTTGAHLILMEPDRHDWIVATVSHLPHVVAGALVLMLQGEDQGLTLAAGGFRDTTRIASGDPGLWTDILLSNHQLVADRLDGLITRLVDFKTKLENCDRDAVHSFLTDARTLRESLPKRKRGLIPSSLDLICIVPDRPGVIGELGSWLGQEGINIADLEVMRVREGDGGTIRLSLSAPEFGPNAVEVLKSHGVKAWLREN
ncbi:MAG: prephenate dehydrogenase/arogenate dehydrogenase family protein [Solirubrobacterales bacterium]